MKSSYPVKLEMLSDFNWKVLEDITYHYKDDIIIVPYGFITDLASVPRILWTFLPPDGEYAKAAIVHDYLYVYAVKDKKYADDVFLAVMSDLGVAAWRKYCLYYTVRLFGKGSYKHR